MKDQSVDPKSQQRPEEQLVSVSAAPPVVYGIGMHFSSDPNHDLDAVQQSRIAQRAYRAEYREKDDWPYPSRTRLARHSGLPALLNGYLPDQDFILDEPESARRSANHWLSQPLLTEALFGVNWDRLQEQGRLAYVGENQVGALVNARYQQRHREWPVYGAQMVVHLALSDPRVSCTSSFFPVKETASLKPPADEEKARDAAKAVALWAVELYVQDIVDLIGLWWEILRPWLETSGTGVSPARPWSDWHSTTLQRLVFALSQVDADKSAGWGDLAAVDSRDDMLAALRESEWRLESFKWQVDAVPYAGSLLFVFPFVGDFQGEYRGNYYLAYQIELESPSGDQAWRVFVDANSGTVLGEPESLITLADVFASSGALLNGQPTPLSTQDLASLTGQAIVTPNQALPPVGTLLDWMFHPDVDPAKNPIDLSPSAVNAAASDAETAGTPADQKRKANATLEAVNIAFHTKKMYEHFLNVCGAAPDKIYDPLRKLQVLVGKESLDLVIGFKHTESNPATITFQSDNTPNGLNADDGKTVFKPSLDPEVIYHEFAHALMWMLNPAPFEQKNENVPFGRALLEGYANYFARSLAAGHGDPAPGEGEPWARGAYRTDQWGDEWALGRDSEDTGVNELLAPNIYPAASTSGLSVYYVGMIWARALWGIRSLLGNELADHLALASYDYVHGWGANYEMAAEGLIDAAKEHILPSTIANIIALFAARGILAERGVQALAAARDATNDLILLIGTDQGVRCFTDNPITPWENWDTETGVVGIATDGAAIYVATEHGVFQRDMQNNRWVAIGTWPTGETPLSILVAVNNIIVGTANGVWRLRTDAQPEDAWEHWKVGGISWSMTAASVPGTDADQLCFISNLTSQCEVTILAEPNPASWSNLRVVTPGARVTDLAVIGNNIVAATAHHGIWQRRDVSYDPTYQIIEGENWAKISGNTFDGKAVLCLGIDRRSSPAHLLAGATDGLYVQTPSGWSRIAHVQQGTRVTGILSAGTRLILGTTNQLIWINDAQGWRSVALPA